MSLFAPKAIPAEVFAENVITFVLDLVKDRARVSAFRDDLRIIRSMRPASERERALAMFYQRLETYLLEEAWRGRYGTEYIRGRVRKKFHPERCLGDFAFLFRSHEDQRFATLSAFLSILLPKLTSFPLFSEALRETIFASPDTFRDGRADFDVIARTLKKMPPINQEAALKKFFRKVIEILQKQHGAIQAENFLRDAYVRSRSNFAFSIHAPWLLTLFPESLLQDERIGLLGRKSLEETVRRRSRELEESNAFLAGERARLQKTVQELKEAHEALEALDKAKGDFIAVVSHQFRTPLSVIRWHTELLEDMLGTKPTNDWYSSLSAIYDKCLFLIDILNNIYDVLAVEGGMAKIELRPTPLWELVDEAIQGKERLVKRRKVAVEFEKSWATMFEGPEVDPHKIRRALDILLTNALQYTPSGGRVRILIDEVTHDGKKALRCSIEDTGIGIDPKDLPNVFTKFFRSKEAIRAVPDGAGLGLYLVKRFIEMHGGEVSVKSTLGQGSTFSFILPVPDAQKK